MNTYFVVEEKKLRTGYTTGSSATAASKAALLSIIRQKKLKRLKLHYPKKPLSRFRLIHVNLKKIKHNAL